MALAEDLIPAFTPGQAAAMGGQYNAFTAAGSVIGDATAITASMAIVAGADGTKGVALTGQVGDSVTIFNNSGSTLKVWPEAAAAIAVVGTGLGTAAAAFSHLTYKTVVYRKFTSTQWVPNISA